MHILIYTMKLPSIHALGLSIKQVLLRFPLQVLSSIIATLAWFYLAGSREGQLREEYLYKIILIANLSLTLLLAGDLYAEVNLYNGRKKWGLRIVGLMICIGLYFLLYPIRFVADIYRVAFLMAAAHLLVAFSPFIRKGNLNGFWQFNKTLFLRFLTSGLYASVLYAGLAIALVAVDGLFNANINSSAYVRLMALVFAGFMTIFFLSGIPEDFEALEKEDFYPKALKIFTQYVLIPLMTIYLGILLVYELKIIINWQLPKGLVSSLILGYAVFGILSLLLIYPIREKAGNGWIKLFSRFFYVMMLPLLALLLLAIWKRVGNYGITESRYVLMVLSLWLFFVTVYFLFSKTQNIKIIPVSLCVLSLLAIYGPQSASSVSRYAQVKRLKMLFASKKEKDVAQREDVIRYLVGRHGLSVLQPFTKVKLDAVETRMEQRVTGTDAYRIKYDKIDTALALLHVKKGWADSDNKLLSFITEGTKTLSIKGYDFMVEVNSFQRDGKKQLNGIPLLIKTESSDLVLKVELGTDIRTEFDVLPIMTALKSMYTVNKNGRLQAIAGFSDTYDVPQNLMSITRKFDHYDLTFLISSMKFYEKTAENRKDNWSNFSGYLLIRVK